MHAEKRMQRYGCTSPVTYYVGCVRGEGGQLTIRPARAGSRYDWVKEASVDRGK
jgi:hypothetical protein